MAYSKKLCKDSLNVGQGCILLTVATQVISVVPLGHPCRFHFVFFRFSFLFFLFFVFSSPFCRFPCSRAPLPCSFFVRSVLSSCRFRFVACIAFFAFLFASLLSLVADYIILLLSSRRYAPPALLASLKYAHSHCLLSSFLRC